MIQSAIRRLLEAAALATLGGGLGYALVTWSAPQDVSAMTVAWIVAAIVVVGWLWPNGFLEPYDLSLEATSDDSLSRHDDSDPRSPYYVGSSYDDDDIRSPYHDGRVRVHHDTFLPSDTSEDMGQTDEGLRY